MANEQGRAHPESGETRLFSEVWGFDWSKQEASSRSRLEERATEGDSPVCSLRGDL